MCGSIVDIQCATAEIRRGKEKKKERKKKPQGKNIMSASAMQGGHKEARLSQRDRATLLVEIMAINCCTIVQKIALKMTSNG